MQSGHEAFAAVYNDVERHPLIADVAAAMGCSARTVRRKAAWMRELFQLDGVVPALVERTSTSRDHNQAAECGELGYKPVLPGFVIRQTSSLLDEAGEIEKSWVKQVKEPGPEFELPKGHVVKGVSALVDGENRILAQWVKTREDLTPEDTVAIIKNAFLGYEGRAVSQPVPVAPAYDLLTLFPCNDWHIGMYAWGAETGENWDLKIAEEVIGRSMDELIERTPSSEHAIILGGGDLLHADNQENRTARSGNQLDVDGRYPKVLMSASRLMVRTIDAALRRHNKVTVRILPGNHDEHAAVAVSYFLLAWYRSEPRVDVDVSPGLFFWHRFGSVMLGATHGHSVKLKDMAGIMAHRRAKDWGDTKFRYAHGFHIHHKSAVATEGNGCIAETHQAPIPQDAWHYGSGFLSGRSLQAISYHRAYGEISRARVAILDGEKALRSAA